MGRPSQGTGSAAFGGACPRFSTSLRRQRLDLSLQPPVAVIFMKDA